MFDYREKGELRNVKKSLSYCVYTVSNLVSTKMGDLNCCRERFCFIPLQTSCYIFVLLDLISWTSVSLWIFGSDIHHIYDLRLRHLLLIIAIGLIWTYLLYLGVTRKHHQILTSFIVVTIVWASAAAYVFICYLFDIIVYVSESVDSHISMLIFHTIFCGAIDLFLITQILVVRNYQSELQLKRTRRPIEIV